MKHIKKIDELYKGTYMSAADKLSKLHPKRAEELEDYARTKGINKKVEREFHYKFYLANHWNKNDRLRNIFQIDEYFFITKAEQLITQHNVGIRNKLLTIANYNILIESNYGNKIRLNSRLITSSDVKENYFTLCIDDAYVGGKDARSVLPSCIALTKRKDALNLKRALLEVTNKDDREMVGKFSVNLMYNQSS